MRKILASVLLAAACLTAANTKKPKLIVAIVIDQFRYDYLTRFRTEYTAGFERLLTQGAVFTDARYIHFPTVTAVGHSTFLSGATPSVSGIVGNEWFDRDEGKRVTAASDAATLLLGSADPTATGASPRRMLVSTIGDEIKMADGGKAKVIGISLKERAAILPAGHMANGAFWFDNPSRGFVSSTYYFPELPGWVREFNAAHLGDKHRGETWLTHKMPEDPAEFYGDSNKSPFTTSPFGNEIVELLAERAVEAEQLGRHETTDVLAVSFSSNDLVGHEYGPYSPEVRDISLQTDQLLEKLFLSLDRQVGLKDTLIVLTADHGVAPTAQESEAHHMPGGRMPAATPRAAIQNALVARFGKGNWIAGTYDLSVYLDRDLMAAKKLDPAEVRRVAAQALYQVDHIARVYTREQLAGGLVLADDMSRRVMNGYNLRRGADLEIMPEPYWTIGDKNATHATTYSYDNHVPVIFLGPGIRPGEYDGSIAVNDIAPTLAAILHVETPSGSVGRVLTEMLAR
jgi:predicted AlkP superfamily pyrophosphatase or phosphodiesterase